MSNQLRYLQIYLTDLRQIFGIDITVEADDQSEISFSILAGQLSWQAVLVILSTQLISVTFDRWR